MNTNVFFVYNLILIVVLLIGLLVVTLLTVFKFKKAKRSQEQLLQSLTLTENERWFRVNIARPAYFNKRIKLVGFEARGILISGPERVCVIGCTHAGVQIKYDFLRPNLNLCWLGNTGISSSNMHWSAIGEGEDKVMIAADTGAIVLQSREAAADICRSIEQQFQLPEAATTDFALEKNPASLGLLLLAAIVLCYASVDGVIVNQNELIKLGSAAIGLSLAYFLGFSAYMLLTLFKVPSRESLVLAMLLGISLSLAYVPMIKRVDQLLSNGHITVQYQLLENAKFKPLISGAPELNFKGVKEYWAQFELGSVHSFEMIHGPLGIWQLDHSTLDPKYQAFYDKNN